MSLLLGLLLQGADAAPVPVIPTPVKNPHPPIPESDPTGWITTDDYPMEAWNADIEGDVYVRLLVDEKGYVAECTPQADGNPLLKEASCRLIQERAKFIPGTNVKGKPVKGNWSRTIRWQMEKKPDAYTTFRTLEKSEHKNFTLIVEKDGRITNCSGMSERDGVKTSNDQDCPPASMRIEPFRDADGNPVRKRLSGAGTIFIETVPD